MREKEGEFTSWGLLGWNSFKWYRRTISHRCRETYQTSYGGETKPTPSVDIPGSCGEGNETQNRSNGIVRETGTHHQAVFQSVIYQKQAITYSLEQAATVWDIGDRTTPAQNLQLRPTSCRYSSYQARWLKN
jgi:hypothetical protein